MPESVIHNPPFGRFLSLLLKDLQRQKFSRYTLQYQGFLNQKMNPFGFYVIDVRDIKDVMYLIGTGKIKGHSLYRIGRAVKKKGDLISLFKLSQAILKGSAPHLVLSQKETATKSSKEFLLRKIEDFARLKDWKRTEKDSVWKKDEKEIDINQIVDMF